MYNLYIIYNKLHITNQMYKANRKLMKWVNKYMHYKLHIFIVFLVIQVLFEQSNNQWKLASGSQFVNAFSVSIAHAWHTDLSPETDTTYTRDNDYFSSRVYMNK